MKYLDKAGLSRLWSNLKPKLAEKESSANKVTSISSSSTDTQYPSAKAVYDALQNIENTAGDTLPVGSISAYSGENIPTNWLKCNGQAVSRTDYAELFKAIGTTYGSGDGSTTFNLPDLSERVVVGNNGDGKFSLGSTGGEKEHTLVTTELPKYLNMPYGDSGSGESAFLGSAVYVAASKRGSVAINIGGTNEPHNNMQPYIALNYIIKVKQSAGIIGTVTSDINDTNDNAVPNAKTVKNYVDSKINIFDLVYPVGSIYMSVNNTDPSTLFGGTWVSWGAGRVPVGVDSSVNEFNAVEKTGGEKEHTLTVNEMPSHTHLYRASIGAGNAEGSLNFGTTSGGVITGQWGNAIQSSGNSQPHNNMQPYITCYMWKRTA